MSNAHEPDLSAPLLFVDCETTGLTHDDRIVTIGLVELDPSGELAPAVGHYIFNPGRPSNPFAAAVHGYDDWTLRHQPDFADHAGEILPLFARAGRIVAHNAAFDERFVRTAFAEAGHELAIGKFGCTMKEWRRRYGSPAGLDPVITQLGIKPRGKTHGALEDAWLCMRVYCALNDLPDPGDARNLTPPVNWVEPAPRPLRGQRSLLWR